MIKPQWLRKKIRLSDHLQMQTLLSEGNLHTICEEALCPNISECFRQKVATFMILGTRCTRGCTFCAVERGKPLPPDPAEPERIAQAVQQLGLRHVVITSPTRDDLEDGGSEHFCETVRRIGKHNSEITIELLIPDMNGNDEALNKIANSGAKVIGHNVETVPRLYHIRQGSEYMKSLHVLRDLLRFNPNIVTKSAIMLGLGERDDEVLAVMADLLDTGCRLLSIGQYLSPSSDHEKVLEYVEPERFVRLREAGIEMGFEYIQSSPYTRSSYLAHDYLKSAKEY